jgi:hypothetical protein
MAHSKVFYTRDVGKFDGTYFNVWKYKQNLFLKAKKLWPIVFGIEAKLEAPSAAQIAAGTAPLQIGKK